MTRKEIACTICLAVVAGLLAAACFPPVGFAVFLPFAIGLLLFAIEGRTVRQAVYTGILFGMVFFGVGLHWFVNLFGAAAVSLWAIAAIFPAIFCGLYNFLRIRLPGIPAPLLAATLWTGIEFFRAEWMRPNFGFFSWGYAVVDVPVLMWFAQIFGGFGLTFGIVAFSAWLVEALRQNRNGSLAFRICLAVWAVVFLMPRSVPTPDPANRLTVRVVQAMSEDDDAMLNESLKPDKVDVIVLPEYAFLSDLRTEPKRWNKLADAAHTKNAYLIFGAKRGLDKQDETAFENVAWLLNPQGQVVGSHVKNHSVHFVNDGKASQAVQAWQTDRGRFGIAICFDFDFTDIARRLAQDGAQVFLVPSNNPAEWGWVQHLQHRQMFQMRAAENRRWLATSDVAGNTFVVAPNGQITAQYSHMVEPGSIDSVVGLENRQTLYVRGGWLFAPLCTLSLPFLLIVALKPRPLKTHEPNQFQSL